VDEGGLAEIPDSQDSPCKGEALIGVPEGIVVQVSETFQGFRCSQVAFESGGIEADTHGFEGFQLLFSVFEEGVCFFHGLRRYTLTKVFFNYLHRLKVHI
jgi:hypothetical protein